MNNNNQANISCQGDGSYAVNSDKVQMRPPKGETVNRLRNANGVVGNNLPGETRDNQSSSNDSKTSQTLSATAQEFVPKGIIYPLPVSSTLSANAQEFFPKQSSREPQYQHPGIPESQNYTSNDNQSRVMQEFNKTMSILNSKPGNMKEYMDRLVVHLRTVQKEDILKDIVESLYYQCVNTINFRYTGARICQYFNQNLKDHHIFKNFRGVFLKRCKSDFEQRDVMLQQNNTTYVQGVALFMAELFLNMEASEGTKFSFLASSLSDFLLSLISHPSKDNIKCAVQMLKLAGASIEENLQLQSKDLNDVFSQLQHLQYNPNVEENAKLMIKSVMDLRMNNWGRGDSVSSVESLSRDMNSMNLSYSVLESAPVYFDANGVPITRVEAGYQDESDDGCDYLLNEEEDLDYLQWEQECGILDQYNGEQQDIDSYQPWSYNETPYVQWGPEYDNEAVDAFDNFLNQSH